MTLPKIETTEEDSAPCARMCVYIVHTRVRRVVRVDRHCGRDPMPERCGECSPSSGQPGYWFSPALPVVGLSNLVLIDTVLTVRVVVDREV